MSELPILFKAEMVRAILAGRKTQTRRTRGLPAGPEWWCRGVERIGTRWYARLTDGHVDREVASPFGGPGDTLWVKETWAIAKRFLPTLKRSNVWYPATSVVPSSALPLRSSMLMPRWASRIDLTIVDVTVERLRSITASDALAEGVELNPAPPKHAARVRFRNYSDSSRIIYNCEPIDSFRTLWESINGLRSWVANPLVWVVRFRR